MSLLQISEISAGTIFQRAQIFISYILLISVERLLKINEYFQQMRRV